MSEETEKPPRPAPAKSEHPAQKDITAPSPETGSADPPADERNGPKGKEPTRYGDWENNGIAWDF